MHQSWRGKEQKDDHVMSRCSIILRPSIYLCWAPVKVTLCFCWKSSQKELTNGGAERWRPKARRDTKLLRRRRFWPKKVKKEPNVNTVNEICTSDVEVLSEWPQICPAVASVHGDNKEVEFVDDTGNNALTDFPHARACCLIHPSQAGPVKHCENCFCYVCNKPVADCTE
jgi:hypothetical protein